MMRIKGHKRKTAWLLMVAMILSLMPVGPWSPLAVHAVTVGTNTSGNIDVTDIELVKNHAGFDVTGAVLQVFGSNLTGTVVLFDFPGVGFVGAGVRSTDSNDGFIKYTLSQTEAQNFTGRIRIASSTLRLVATNYPTLQSLNKQAVNKDLAETLQMNGSSLDRINAAGVTAVYGRGLTTKPIVPLADPAPTASQITIRPPSDSLLGLQDITITEVGATSTATGSTVNGINTSVQYSYGSAFRIVQNLTLNNLNMFPNAGAKGDTIYLTSDEFPASSGYQVYFLGTGEGYSTINRSPSVVLSPDRKQLTVQVPNNASIPLGTKTVRIVDTLGGQIISEATVGDTFSLIDASFNPIIDRINPDSGPDTGSAVQIKGKNLLTLSLPNLNGYTGINTAAYANADKRFDLTYNTAGLTYQGSAVTSATRSVTAIIGKEAFFEREGGAVKYAAGVDDYVYVVTDTINDAKIDPKKDVILQMTTTLVTAGQTYVFNQAVTVADGFTFIPSSLEPTVTAVNPDKVHITATRFMKENTLLSIEGSNFMVNKWTDSSGIIHVNYPVVLIQNADSLGTGSFILLFDKNGEDGTLNGRIFTNSDYSPTGMLLDGGTPVTVDMVVLNAENGIVDGTVGNEIGNRIVLYLPKLAQLDAGGKKNIQVINPRRDSDVLGDEGIALDIVDFVIANDTPVIESVSPNIVTIEGGDTVTVTGTNFQEGAKVYIDGKAVAGVTRSIDVQGNKVVLSFKAPKGRLGKTQLQVVNPLGGIAVRDFYYVLSFNKDPKITTVAPDRGTVGTLVAIEGDNFFKPDPTVQSASGMDAFRLLGSRVFLDGSDVNLYNKDSLDNVTFLAYSAPANQPLFSPVNGKVVTTPLYENTYITDNDTDKVYKLQFDSSGNPVLYDGDSPLYTIRNTSGTLQAFDAEGVYLDDVTIDADSIEFGSVSLIVTMNNRILGIGRNSLGKYEVQVANYAHSVIFEAPTGNEFFTVEKLFDGTVRLSNGQLGKYTIRLDDVLNPTGLIAVQDGGGSQDLTVTGTTLTLVDDAKTLTMKTPYIKDADGIITGNRSKVISKNQILFTVPLLTTGQGFKTVAVENPDTKRATKANGFFYYASPATKPVISAIVPDKGSVDGGYLITLIGKDYEETSRVYIDGVAVPVADTTVNLGGTQLVVKVPKYSRVLADYNTDSITVPVVVLNQDGGSASRAAGFTYVNPASTPKVNSIILNTGSTNGGEIVEILGYDFRYFEPYKDTTGGPGYDITDEFTNLNSYFNSTWDNVTANSGAVLEPTDFPNNAVYSFYSQYFKTPILPKVYFGTKEAKIVDFATGYLKVVSPANAAGVVDVYVVNNDSGISNKLKYTYQSSNPKISYINPAQGARIGQETRDIYGERLAKNPLPGYDADDATAIVPAMPNLDVLVRFADITNRKITLGQPNDGRINAERATVALEGNLSVEYRGDLNQLTVFLQENGKTYSRVFTNYQDEKLLLPAGMLKAGDEYYVPNNYGYDGAEYNTDTRYELILVEVDPVAKRFYVERGYAPQTTYDNATHVVLDTPSYYSVGQVNVTFTNPDGGTATTKYTYRNPASKPTIEKVNPQSQIPDENAWMVEATVKGGITIEIKGHDFRDGVKVYLDKKPMTVLDITVDNTDPADPLDVIIARVPAGTDAEIGLRYPIIVENADGGIANSADSKTLTSADQWPIYFIYRKPLSDPVILTISPAESSVWVNTASSPVIGNEITLTGTDFRAGAMVIIGSIGGVPVTPHYIEPQGRIMKFYIPPNLTVGPKDIQVINADFGTGTKPNGLKIVSYPQVTSIRSEDGTAEVEWVSVEGGTKIRINGSGFDAGAKVFFGGTRTLQTAKGTAANIGLWRDNNYYAVAEGTPSPAVTFVDSTALTVTVPAVFKEKEFTVTVINGDTGISDGDATIRYSVPVPSAPLNLDAAVVSNKYIQIFGYTSSNFDYFEVYTYVGNKSASQLRSNDYKDFRYLTTTQIEPYKITRLDEVADMGSNDRVYLVLKAVNKYGPSSWSNIASLRYSEVDNIQGGLGVEDFDGNLDVPAGQATGTAVSAQQAVVTVSKTALKNMTTVDLTGPAYAAVTQTIVNVPETVVANNYNRITLKTRQGQLGFHPAALNTPGFQRIAAGDGMDTYASLRLEPLTTDYAGLIQRYIPRELKAYSQPYRLGSAASSNAGTLELYDRMGQMDLALNYLSPLPTGLNPADLKLYYYDSSSSRWIMQFSTVDTFNRLVSSKATLPGIYMVLGPR